MILSTISSIVAFDNDPEEHMTTVTFVRKMVGGSMARTKMSSRPIFTEELGEKAKGGRS